MTKLKPCACSASTKNIQRWWSCISIGDKNKNQYYIECKNCNNQTQRYNDMNEAIEAWNILDHLAIACSNCRQKTTNTNKINILKCSIDLCKECYAKLPYYLKKNP